MQRKSLVSRPRLETRGLRGASLALGRLEREHVALLLAICELEAPADEAEPTASGTAVGGPEVRRALLALLREDLRRTQHALTLAACGRYGLCEECHRPLSRRTLELKPATTRCAICAAQARRAALA
jgi:RNA polymerase-binding transcription factor DksA